MLGLPYWSYIDFKKTWNKKTFGLLYWTGLIMLYIGLGLIKELTKQTENVECKCRLN